MFDFFEVIPAIFDNTLKISKYDKDHHSSNGEKTYLTPSNQQTLEITHKQLQETRALVNEAAQLSQMKFEERQKHYIRQLGKDAKRYIEKEQEKAKLKKYAADQKKPFLEREMPPTGMTTSQFDKIKKMAENAEWKLYEARENNKDPQIQNLRYQIEVIEDTIKSTKNSHKLLYQQREKIYKRLRGFLNEVQQKYNELAKNDLDDIQRGISQCKQELERGIRSRIKNSKDLNTRLKASADLLNAPHVKSSKIFDTSKNTKIASQQAVKQGSNIKAPVNSSVNVAKARYAHVQSIVKEVKENLNFIEKAMEKMDEYSKTKDNQFIQQKLQKFIDEYKAKVEKLSEKLNKSQASFIRKQSQSVDLNPRTMGVLDECIQKARSKVQPSPAAKLKIDNPASSDIKIKKIPAATTQILDDVIDPNDATTQLKPMTKAEFRNRSSQAWIAAASDANPNDATDLVMTSSASNGNKTTGKSKPTGLGTTIGSKPIPSTTNFYQQANQAYLRHNRTWGQYFAQKTNKAIDAINPGSHGWATVRGIGWTGFTSLLTHLSLDWFTDLGHSAKEGISTMVGGAHWAYMEASLNFKAYSGTGQSLMQFRFPTLHRYTIQIPWNFITRHIKDVFAGLSYTFSTQFFSQVMMSIRMSLASLRNYLLSAGVGAYIYMSCLKDGIVLYCSQAASTAFGAGVIAGAKAVIALAIGFLIGMGIRKTIDYFADAGYAGAKAIRVGTEAPFAFFTSLEKDFEWGVSNDGHMEPIKRRGASGSSPAYKLLTRISQVSKVIDIPFFGPWYSAGKGKKWQWNQSHGTYEPVDVIPFETFLTSKEKEFFTFWDYYKIPEDAFYERKKADKSVLSYVMYKNKLEIGRRKKQFKKWCEKTKNWENKLDDFKPSNIKESALCLSHKIHKYRIYPCQKTLARKSRYTLEILSYSKSNYNMLIETTEREIKETKSLMNAAQKDTSLSVLNYHDNQMYKNSIYTLFYQVLVVYRLLKTIKAIAQIYKKQKNYKKVVSFWLKNKKKLTQVGFWQGLDLQTTERELGKLLRSFENVALRCKKYREKKAGKKLSENFLSKEKKFLDRLDKLKKTKASYLKYLQKTASTQLNKNRSNHIMAEYISTNNLNGIHQKSISKIKKMTILSIGQHAKSNSLKLKEERKDVLKQKQLLKSYKKKLEKHLEKLNKQSRTYKKLEAEFQTVKQQIKF